MTEQRKLELTLADQLPWGLKVKIAKDNLFNDEIFVVDSIARGGSINCTVDDIDGWDTFHIDDFKPILFDLSSLTEPITVNGETFVPLEYLEKNYLAENWERMIKNLIEYERWINHCPLLFIELLDKWHFNRRGLSPDQFINVKDLETNPYQ